MSNKLNLDLSNRVVLVGKEFLNDEVTDRRFICESGFGIHPFTNGTKIFGRWLCDNEKGCINGYSIEKLVVEK